MALHRITTIGAIVLPELYFLAGLLAGIVQGMLSAFCAVKQPTPEVKAPAPAQIPSPQITAKPSSKGVVPIPPTAMPATPEPQQPSNAPKTTRRATPNSSFAGDKSAHDDAGQATTVGDADIDGALQAMWFGSTPEAVTNRVR